MKKTLSLVAIAPLALFGLAACGVATDGTYTTTEDGIDYTLVLDTSESTAEFTAEDDGNTVELKGTLNDDDEEITWSEANTSFDNSVLDSINDFFADSSFGSDISSDIEGSTSSYERDGDTITLNIDGDTLELERTDD